jgi:hypothetical protein
VGDLLRAETCHEVANFANLAAEGVSLTAVDAATFAFVQPVATQKGACS